MYSHICNRLILAMFIFAIHILIKAAVLCYSVAEVTSSTVCNLASHFLKYLDTFRPLLAKRIFDYEMQVPIQSCTHILGIG